jgi:hypothetical protein
MLVASRIQRWAKKAVQPQVRPAQLGANPVALGDIINKTPHQQQACCQYFKYLRKR